MNTFEISFEMYERLFSLTYYNCIALCRQYEEICLRAWMLIFLDLLIIIEKKKTQSNEIH